MEFKRRERPPAPAEIDSHTEVDSEGREWTVRMYEPTVAPLREPRGSRLSVSESSLLAAVARDARSSSA
jgi:hypothetical protein